MAKPSTRTKNESRAAKVAQGYVQKAWLLSPGALKALAKITRRDGTTETDAVARALDAYANPDLEPSNDELVAMVKARLK